MLWEQAQLSNDIDFTARVAAAAAVELDWTGTANRPVGWTSENIWLVAAAPGFAAAYSSAIASGVEHPGRDTSVISDEQITAAVQAMRGTQ
jgi:hypothetical protein